MLYYIFKRLLYRSCAVSLPHKHKINYLIIKTVSWKETFGGDSYVHSTNCAVGFTGMYLSPNSLSCVLNMYSFLYVNATSIKCLVFFSLVSIKWFFKEQENAKDLDLLSLPTQRNLERGPQLISLRVSKSFLMAQPHSLSKCSPVTCK